MNYMLYHRKTFSIAVHGVTFVLDGLLWMLYFHHLLRDILWWKYGFVFFLTIVQSLTYSDIWIRHYLMYVHSTYVVLSIIVSQLIDQYELTFPVISIVLIVNAILRVISHIPEKLPIHFFEYVVKETI